MPSSHLHAICQGKIYITPKERPENFSLLTAPQLKGMPEAIHTSMQHRSTPEPSLRKIGREVLPAFAREHMVAPFIDPDVSSKSCAVSLFRDAEDLLDMP